MTMLDAVLCVYVLQFITPVRLNIWDYLKYNKATRAYRILFFSYSEFPFCWSWEVPVEPGAFLVNALISTPKSFPAYQHQHAKSKVCRHGGCR